MIKAFYILPLFLIIASCSSSGSAESQMNTEEEMVPEKRVGEAFEIIDRSIEAHGGKQYDEAHFQFVFRDRIFTFNNDGDTYEYTATYSKEGDSYEDVLNNEGFVRTINEERINLTEEEEGKYGESVNSVIYFATLPHKLNDPAVNAELVQVDTIAGKVYDAIKVTFDEEGGGTDHDDIFFYWIEQETGFMDYLAYSYAVNGGGVRFRSAYNQRTIGSIRFQDYVNYGAPLGTGLGDLPGLFESDSLEELSIIASENIIDL